MAAEEQIDLASYLLIAERVTGQDAADLARLPGISLAQSGLEAAFAGYDSTYFYDDAAERAAITCSRLVRNHPLPDGNKRVALLCMLEQIHRAGLTWIEPDQTELAEMIESLAAGTFSEREFIVWVQKHTS